jgi:hypothetical protein
MDKKNAVAGFGKFRNILIKERMAKANKIQSLTH